MDLFPNMYEATDKDDKLGVIIYWCTRYAEDEEDAEKCVVFVTWAFPDGTTWVTPRDLWNTNKEG